MLLDCVSDLLSDHGVLWLAGENKAGIKSAEKLIKKYFRDVKKLDNARHCCLYEAAVTHKQSLFDPLSYRQVWPLKCNQTSIDIVSYPGVFAHGRLDAGTGLLLKALSDQIIQGDVLDFACGAGVIGSFIKANLPATRVTLSDVNSLALRACEETLAENGTSATIVASDGFSQIDECYDLIVTNPPIHADFRTDNHMGVSLLKSITEHIKVNGMLVMVANIHLPYEKWLAQNFRYHRELTKNNKYKVILAKN